MKKLLLILLCLTLLFSTCKDVSLSIGQTHQGGIIFYLDGNGGGLIVAPSDQSNERAVWGWQGKSITGADGTAIGTGQQNTIDILAARGSQGTAAEKCANLTLNGYSDWFLPSKWELNKMYLNLAMQGLGGGYGGFGKKVWCCNNNSYWSSTEFMNWGHPSGAVPPP